MNQVMEPLSPNTRSLFPCTAIQHHGDDKNSGNLELPAKDLLPPPRSRRVNPSRAPRKTRNEWEKIKVPFAKLYVDEDLPLKEVIERLQRDHNFDAT